MGKGRLEAFSDGVLAVALTIMVLEIKAPEGTSAAALWAVVPSFLTYVLSFIYVAIYWNNHHHLLHTARRVNGRILWANLHLLFWLTLIPFATKWLSEGHEATLPTVLYGVVLMMSGAAYAVLVRAIVSAHGGETSELAQAIGRDIKGKLSVVVYAVAIGMAFWRPWLSIAMYTSVALMWLIPDRRIESRVNES